MSAIETTVTLKGKLFEKKIDDVVKRQLVAEVLTKVDERTQRQGKGLGARRNTVRARHDGLEMPIESTLHWPRTKGTSWQRKNIGIVKAMAPRVLRKAAERIVNELGQ